MGAGLILYLLIGTFLGRIQATFEQTARSYSYFDAGSAQCVFGRSPTGGFQLNSFLGHLPGFYFVLLDLDGKAVPRLDSQQPTLFGTDVGIDFTTTPYTVTGTISEVDGDGQFPITDVYPEIGPITVNVVDVDGGGRYDLRITVHAVGVDGETLEYSLVWHARLSASGLSLEGDVDIERVLTTADGEEIRIDGSGSLTTTKQ